MTTFASPRNRPELARGLWAAAGYAVPDGDTVAALSSMAAFASGDRSAPPECTWACRPLAAAALRRAADQGYPEELRDIADALEETLQAAALNRPELRDLLQRLPKPAPAPEPVAEPVPVLPPPLPPPPA
jgi:ABC-type nitrate/sulfonate/bicarbonate transport system substrate-binding protein